MIIPSTVDAFGYVRNCFADVLCEADEYIQREQLTADELINAFAAAIIEQSKYYTDKSKVYDNILFAISQRGRNK